MFQELTAAKADVSHLTCDQLLRKDVKVASEGGLRVGVASVPLRVMVSAGGGGGVWPWFADRVVSGADDRVVGDVWSCVVMG